jgi:hypothetical protein
VKVGFGYGKLAVGDKDACLIANNELSIDTIINFINHLRIEVLIAKQR